MRTTLASAELDAEYRSLATEYKRSSRILERRIKKIKKDIRDLPPKRSNEAKATELNERLKILNQMYRTTTEIGREVGGYYIKGWWRSEIYTVNHR